jgi:putative Mn2+ efflux pump MntP
MFGTAEPLALALAVLGLSLLLDGRPLAVGLGFAGVALTKETYLVFAGVAAGWLLPAGELLARFLSSMRTLAPTVLAAGLAIAATARRRTKAAGAPDRSGAAAGNARPAVSATRRTS